MTFLKAKCLLYIIASALHDFHTFELLAALLAGRGKAKALQRFEVIIYRVLYYLLWIAPHLSTSTWWLNNI